MKMNKQSTYRLFICSFIVILFTTFNLSAQNIPGSEVAGSWNLTVETEEGEKPSWLYIKTSGISTLVGKFVGIEGSARPISEINYSEHTGVYLF